MIKISMEAPRNKKWNNVISVAAKFQKKIMDSVIY
jgi:hypothetical protein